MLVIYKRDYQLELHFKMFTHIKVRRQSNSFIILCKKSYFKKQKNSK